MAGQEAGLKARSSYCQSLRAIQHERDRGMVCRYSLDIMIAYRANGDTSESHKR